MNKLTYTDEQFNYLAQFESQFDCIIHRRYNPRPLARGAYEAIRDIYREATGSHIGGSASCSQCVARVLRAAGGKWYEDKELREEMAAQRAAEKAQKAAKTRKVAKADKPVTKTRKTVKTAKKGK